MSTPRPLRLAHRGDWRRAPENSLAAMVAALRIPACGGLEFDVQTSRDGVPILLHDDTLERVQDRPERPDELDATELASLGVPTLASVLAAVPGAVFLDVELKGDPGRAVVDVLRSGRGDGLRQAVISSFEGDALERVAGWAPRWPRWLNTEVLAPATLRAALDLGCRGISADWRSIDPGSASRIRAAGLDLAAWTVRRRPTFDRLAELGVVAVCVEAAALDG